MKTVDFGCHGLTFDGDTTKSHAKSMLPLAADFALPCSCLNKCSYCGYYLTQEGIKLSNEEIDDIIEQLAALEIKSIRIVGEGEPFLRNDILKIRT